MKHTKKYLLSGLGMAAGSMAAAFGVRAGVRWWQDRSRRQRAALGWPQTGPGRRFQPTGAEPDSMLFHPAEQSYTPPEEQWERLHDAIPATGGETLSYATPTPPVLSETPPRQADRVEPDFNKQAKISDTSFDMDSLAGPLIEYLIAFNSIMNVVRSHKETQTESGAKEMTLGDREGMRNVLDQVEDRLPHENASHLKSGSLEDRTYRLTVKIRDSLTNLSYTDSDFLRLYDEIGPEVCKVTQALEESGSVSITGIDQVRDMYECGHSLR